MELCHGNEENEEKIKKKTYNFVFVLVKGHSIPFKIYNKKANII